MKKRIVKIRINKLEYNRENNLFQMHIQEIETGNETVLAVKGEDWGITSDIITDEVVNDFCEKMKGQEKNLHIEKDTTSISHTATDEIITQEKLTDINNNIDKYPINEIMNSLPVEEENES